MNITFILLKVQRLRMLNTRVMKTRLKHNYHQTYSLDRYNKSQQLVASMLKLILELKIINK